MTLTIKARTLLHPKRWEARTPSPATNTAGAFLVAADMNTQMSRIFEVTSVSSIYAYYGQEDAWIQLPGSGLGGTFGAGACGEFHPYGPSGTATGGTTTTLITNLTIVRNLRGHKVRLTGGTGAGAELIVKSNTIGANSVITFTTPAGAAISATTTYQLLTGRLWVFVPSTTAPALGCYDWATNAWVGGRSVTGVATNFGTEGQLIGTDSLRSGTLVSDSAATAGGASTLTDGAKNWTVNALSNLQIRITSGTGAGQVRTIASNTATVITTSAAWTTAPDATSQYVVEGNDDVLLLFGNAAVAVYKYSISGNTWTTITPAVARAGTPGAGMTADWIVGVQDADWNLAAAPQNGRYVYSFRGAAGNSLDRLDLTTYTWATFSYGNQGEAFTTGSNSCAVRERIYVQKDSSARLFYFDVVLNALRPFTTLAYGVGAATAGDKLAALDYTDGAELNFIYLRRPSTTELFRIMEIK